MAALRVLVLSCTLLTVVVESAVIVVGGETGWTTGFDYNAWTTTQNLQLRVGDSLVFSNPNQIYHTVSLLDSAAAYQSCAGGASIHPIPPGTNYTMTIPASLESRTLYAVCTIAGHCTEGQKMKAAVLPGATTIIVSNPNDADVNRYICWTTAVLLIVACFWNSS